VLLAETAEEMAARGFSLTGDFDVARLVTPADWAEHGGRTAAAELLRG
jgi:hypothetical protein